MMQQPPAGESGNPPGLSTDPEILNLLQQLQQIELDQQAALDPQGIPTQAEFDALQPQVDTALAEAMHQMQIAVGRYNNNAANP